ncbi:MAG: hypothetical protein WB987_12150 [Candidatus Acidiferrales bacterium]
MKSLITNTIRNPADASSTPKGNTTAAQGRVAYDHTHAAQAYLLTFKDGGHRAFSGRGRMAPGGEHDKEYQQIVCVASTAFWDATLKRDAAAQRWLEQGGFAALLGSAGTFEQKRPQETPARSHH